MMIIGFLNQKGGSGKTTLSIGIAAEFAKHGRVLLVDADPQGSAMDWKATQDVPGPFDVVRVDRPILHRELPKLSRGYDFTIVDGPPRNADLQRSAILGVTHVLIPIQPSGTDLWATKGFLDLLKDAREMAPAGQKAALVLSRKIGGSALSKSFPETLAGLEDPLPVLTGTSQRVAYAEAMGAGLTVQSYAPGSPAAKELEQLAADIRAL